MLNYLSLRRTRSALVALMAIVATVIAFVLFSGQSPPQTQEQLDLQRVPAEQLELNGIVLHEPAPDTSPAITRENAEALAREAVRQPVTVEETHLAVLTDTSMSDRETSELLVEDRLAWVVSFNPDGYLITPGDVPADYLVTFIDAITGDALFTITAQLPDGYVPPESPPDPVNPVESPPDGPPGLPPSIP